MPLVAPCFYLYVCLSDMEGLPSLPGLGSSSVVPALASTGGPIRGKSEYHRTSPERSGGEGKGFDEGG